MDPIKFRELVGQHAEYVYHTDPGGDNRKDPCSDNPMAMMVITRMKPIPTVCADCDKVCDDCVQRCITWDFVKNRWNQRCLSCKRSFNHTTGKFEYAAKKSNIRPQDPVTGKFLKEHLADEATADGEQQPNDVNQG
jgi:hypothetical protein